MNHLLLFASLVFMLLAGGSAAPAQDVPDSKGRDFWFTFLPNFHNGEQQGLTDIVSMREHELQIYIGAERPTKGTITWRTEDGTTRSQNFVISNPASLYRFAIFYQGAELRGISRSGGALDFLSSQNERVAQQSFHVVADDDVTVYALNQAPLTSEAFLVLPSDAVANDYVVMSYTTDVSGSGGTANPATTPSQFAVVATEDSTVVTIKPAAPTPRNQRAEQFTVTLQQGESFLVQADPRVNSRGDLTGSRVRSTKPVAVFAGHNRALLPIELRSSLTSRDCLIEQMNPVRTWGKSAFVTPLAKPSKDLGVGYDIFRVVAGFDSTEVFVDGRSRRVLRAGEFFEDRLMGAYEITTSRPSLTAQYKSSSGINNPSGGVDTLEYSDPFMTLVPPAEQFMDSYRFINIQSYVYDFDGRNVVIVDSVYKEQWLNVVIPSDKVGTLVLDGTPVNPGGFQPIGSSGFSYAQLKMRDGVHEIKADTLFGIYVYGYGAAVSYGYIGGMAFRPLDVYPPVIAGAIQCEGFRGTIVDTVIADTKVRDVAVVPGTDTNTVLELDAFNPPQAIVPFTVRLRDPFQDGSIEFTATDGVKQKERVRVILPGFTVAITGAGPSLTLRDRSSVVAVGRERCDSIEIENYGKYPRTFTASFTGTTRVDAPQPMTLSPGERRVLRYCRTGTSSQFTTDTLVFRDSCIQRRVAVMQFEERFDDKGPQVLRDLDPCSDVTVVTISDERSSDMGLRSVRLLDSVLVNCTVDTISSVDQILVRQYAISVIDRYADVIYGFEAVDSIGLVTRVIDTIPGFRMSINGMLDTVVRHSFDTTIIGVMECDTIPLENLGIMTLLLPNAYLRGNTIFSAPQAQFGISLASNGGKGALVVCFSPVIGDTSKVLYDTLDFEINCRLRRVILSGVGRRNTFTGISRCDAPVVVRSRKLLGALVTPQPARDRLTVTFDEADVRQATIRLVDLTGVVRWERSWSGDPAAAVEIDCSDVPNGLYGCQITTTRTQVIPVIISR